MPRLLRIACFAVPLLIALSATTPVLADGDLNNVQHIIIVMQENHSFDNYFGVLPYAPGSPYHAANGSCAATDHTCIDALSCAVNGGNLTCSNSNADDNGSTVVAFHGVT